MPLIISDETLLEIGLSEDEALIDFACRMFDVGRLTLWSAARLANLNRVAFEQELLTRGFAIVRPQPADLAEDLEALHRLALRRR